LKKSWPSRAAKDRAWLKPSVAPNHDRRGQGQAVEEGNKIVAAAKAEAESSKLSRRVKLVEQVAALAVKGAEQILRKEVNAVCTC
jgi:hypothetical protein